MVDVPKEEITNASLKESSENVIDDALDNAFGKGEETPEDSTASKKTTSEETEETEEAGADQQKKAESKETEKESDEEEDGLPKDVKYRKNWNKLKTERDEARKALDEAKQSSLSKEEVEQVRKITSSPEYIRLSMKSQGYTDEAINSKLKELGHSTAEKAEDSMSLVLSRLGIDLNSLPQEQKDYVNTYITDVVKVADVLIQDRLNKILPTQIKPIQDKLSKVEAAETAKTYLSQMREIVKNEGILDFEKDVEPLLDKFIEENPKSTQDEVYDYFFDLNHKIALERAKGGKKQQERTAAKENLRSMKEGGRSTPSAKLPTWDGKKPIGDHLDDVLDAVGLTR